MADSNPIGLKEGCHCRVTYSSAVAVADTIVAMNVRIDMSANKQQNDVGLIKWSRASQRMYFRYGKRYSSNRN